MKRRKKSKRDFKSDLKLAVVTDPIVDESEVYRELKHILKTFSNSEIFTPYYDTKVLDKQFAKHKIHDTFLQLLIPEDSEKEFWLKLEKFAYKTFSLKNLDIVLSVSSRCARFVRTEKGLQHIAIVINPRRLFSSGRLFKKEKKALENVHKVLTISNFDKKKLKKVYDIHSEVIYPPVEIEDFKPEKALNRRENWFLANADIDTESLKLLIKSVVKSEVGLKIMGDIKENIDEEKLIKKLKARGFVKFLGGVSKEEKINLMQRCRGYIYPVKEEEFAKEVIEANGAGTPVVLYKKSSLVEFISTKKPKTGAVFEKYNYKSLAKTLKNFKDEEYDSKSCIMKAQEFDLAIFMYKLKTYIEDAIQNN